MTVEDLGGAHDDVTPSGLNPEPIPLQTKVIMLGTPMLFAPLQAEDEEFRQLFKVQVEFNVQAEQGAESVMQYGRFIARLLCGALAHPESHRTAHFPLQSCGGTPSGASAPSVRLLD